MLAGYGDLAGWQEATYRTFHQHPELGDQEVATAATAAQALRETGFEVHEGIGTTGVVGVLRNGDGPVVLMRADMDALPMKAETGLPYASVDRQADANGNMVPVAHACGHDVHVASLMGAARLLAEGRSHWQGTFVALFQPAEELATGAAGMVGSGLAGLLGFHPSLPSAVTFMLTEPSKNSRGWRHSGTPKKIARLVKCRCSASCR